MAELPELAGRHASPAQFHAMLDAAPKLPKPTVLLDARNIYESRIGNFQAVRAPSPSRLSDPLCQSLDRFSDHFGKHCERCCDAPSHLTGNAPARLIGNSRYAPA